MFNNILIEKYVENGYNNIEGWVEKEYFIFLEVLDKIQREFGIKGGGGEIGIHHGKSFIPLALLKNKYTNVAIDVFYKQNLNIDCSGRGDYNIFIKNLNTFAPEVNIILIKEDSTFISDQLISSFRIKYNPLSIFSIDGGHTADNTYSDILLATKFLVNGSFIILDDYYNQDWPGVHEGLIKYFYFGDVKFYPLFYGFNKMVLCSRSYFLIYYNKIITYLNEYCKFVYKDVYLNGHKFLSIKY